MDNVSSNQNISNRMLTEFTDKKILSLMNECLLELMKPDNFIIEEQKIIQNKFNDNSIIWHIEFYKPKDVSDIFKNFKRYIIRVTYFIGDKGKLNIIEFADIGCKLGYICEDKIYSLKYFISKKEREINIRYLEREKFLLFINSSITNYDNYSSDNLNHINEEKKNSKIRLVLENPWFQREITECIDYIKPVVNLSELGFCNSKKMKKDKLQDKLNYKTILN